MMARLGDRQLGRQNPDLKLSRRPGVAWMGLPRLRPRWCNELLSDTARLCVS
jgi:hypothetical protein